jgi:rifampicin phosphotransferase
MAWVVDNQPSTRFPVYTRGNVGEVFPAVVTPLTGTLLVGEAENGFRDAFAKFGALRPGDFGTDAMGVVGVFNGYTYLNASFIRVLAVRTPGLTVADMDRQFFGESEAPPYAARAGDKNLLATLKIGRTLLQTLTTKALPGLDDDKVRVARWLDGLPPVPTATDAELIGVLRRFRPEFRHLFGRHILTTFQATIGPGLLAQMCEGKLGDPTLPNKLLAGIGSVESAAPSTAMWDLSRLDGASEEFRQAFATFLDDFGSRGPNEWEGSSPTWGTDPALAMAAIDRMRGADASHAPRVQLERLERERRAATADSRGRLRGITRVQFDRALRSAHVFSQGRERGKTTVIRAIHGVRLAQRELARRARERGGPDELADFWLVTNAELEDYVSAPSGFAATLAERKAQRETLAALVPPFVFEAVQPPPETWDRRDVSVAMATAGTVLTGIAGCPGIARGRARIVLDPGDPRGLGPGEVLIAPITDPSWTPLFVPAEAVVVEVGAQMSHAVIVSRELGIPAVVSVTGATRLLRDGALVEVNGDRGTVTVIEA